MVVNPRRPGQELLLPFGAGQFGLAGGAGGQVRAQPLRLVRVEQTVQVIQE